MIASPAAEWVPPGLGQAPAFDAFWNALVSHAGTAVPLVGRSAAVFAPSEAPGPDALALGLRCASGARLMAVPVAFPFPALCGADLAVEDLGLLPPPLRDALIDAIVTVTTAALPPSPHLPLAIERTEPWRVMRADPATPSELRWFRGAVHGIAAEPVVFDVGATLPALADLFGALAPRRVWSGLTSHLTRDAHVTLGSMHLSPAEMRSVGVGSVVVLAASPDQASIGLRCDDTLYRFTRADKGWACRSVEELAPKPHLRTPTMANDSDDASDGAAPQGPGRLDIRLDLDIGTLVVPLAEVETWQPGSIVALRSLPDVRGVAVTLRSNGQAIGTGDLVTIDDRIAVRIASLAFS